MRARCFIGILLLLAGCAGQWEVLKQAKPNPFVGQKSFGLEPLTFDDLHVGKFTEEDYLAKQTLKQKANFMAGKNNMGATFNAHLRAVTGKNGIGIAPPGQKQNFTLKPIIDFIEPGSYSPLIDGVTGPDNSWPTYVHMELSIYGAQGNELDHVIMIAKIDANIRAFSTSTRLERAAEVLAQKINDYLVIRLGLTKGAR